MNFKSELSIIIPAKNENFELRVVLHKIQEHLKKNFECLIIVDNENDDTIKNVFDIVNTDSRFRFVLNDLGNSPAFAIRKGIQESKSEIVVVMMADGSDDALQIGELVELIQRGVAIACASRYMPGGQQVGAKRLKSLLSRLAGRSLKIFANIGTNDCTNSFKAYSKDFVDRVGINSEHGFELGIELVVKAKINNYLIAELPTIWIERNRGVSNFKIIKWLPKYMYWYLHAFILKSKYKV